MAVILLIEDDDQVAQLIADIAEQIGHEVHRSPAAYGALQKMEQSGLGYALVIIDMVLQGANGAVAALGLRGMGYKGPMVLMTGNLVPIDQGLYARAEFTGRLLKPFSIDDMKNEIARQLTNAGDEHENRGGRSEAL